MNKKLIAPTLDKLMGRIKRVSARLKMLFLVASLISAVISLSAMISTLHSLDGFKLRFGIRDLIWAAIYWCASKLFQACSCGNLFTGVMVRQISRIGCLGILLGLEEGIVSFVVQIGIIPFWSNVVFSLLDAFDIVPGIAILCIAWIMDEGRKIQEEQELTV